MKHLKKFNESKEENISLKEEISSNILEVQDYFKDNNYFLSIDTIEEIYDELERTKRGSGAVYQLLNSGKVCIRLTPIRAPKSAQFGLSSKFSLNKKVEAEKKWCDVLEDIKVAIDRSGNVNSKTLETNGILWIVVK